MAKKPSRWENIKGHALTKAGTHQKEAAPERSMYYCSGRSSNEAGFLFQLVARVHGSNNVNNCSYYCHQASGVGLKSVVGTGTATVTLEDLASSDFLFLIGCLIPPLLVPPLETQDLPKP